MPPNQTRHPEEVYVEVDIKKLPSFTDLRTQVKRIVDESSWFERYGFDLIPVVASFASVPVALLLLRYGGVMNFIAATIILGTFHAIVSNRAGHISAHGGLAQTTSINNFLFVFTSEFIGMFSTFIGELMHVQGHHPHTNIIGLGDSSVWKIPQLSRVPYLFGVPFLFPILTPIVSLKELIEGRYWKQLVYYIPTAFGGLALHVYLLNSISGFCVTSALVYIFFYRALFAMAFVHINIFQHIGLPMYARESKPARIYQMSTGVLNLARNPIMDVVFGHALYHCHVEHHLFPRLSDNMCLKIKPVVRAYLRKHGLPYNEDSYMSRLSMFWERYDELMVDAPPVTHFIGIQ